MKIVIDIPDNEIPTQQAKKIYHNMVEDWRIRKNMEKITEGLKNEET